MADKLHVTLNECVHDQPAFSVKTSYKNKRRSDALVSRLDLDQHSEPKRAQTSTFAEVLWLPARTLLVNGGDHNRRPYFTA